MDPSKSSPIVSHYGNFQNQNYYNVTSPTNSDGNHYASPSISPGSLYSRSTAPNTVSPQSHRSFQGSPNSTLSREVRTSPPTSPPTLFEAPTLPTRLGSKSNETSRKAIASINKNFLEKSSMDIEREKLANRRLQSLMVEAARKERGLGKSSTVSSFGKNDMHSFLVPCGAEQFATSSRKSDSVAEKEPPVMEDLKGSVNDFKCGFDRDREWAAKKHAMRMISKLDNAA